MDEYYRRWLGIIHIDRYEMLNPRVVADGNMAVLSYNLVNYVHDAGDGRESVASRWYSATVFHRKGDAWKTVHSHWSYTAHAALQSITPDQSERQER